VNTVDATTWQAIGLTLTAVGLVSSYLAYRRRGAAAGLRGAAWSLLPAAAGLTGTLRLLWRIGTSVVDWAVNLVFSPVVWAGLVLLAVSVVLFGASAVLRSRGAGGPPRRVERKSSDRAALPRERRRGAAEPAVQEKDMDDIEAILRKHGIS
jgi:hypothetical protein